MTGYILFTVLGFLSGSILYSYLLVKIFCDKDITDISEDGNPGAHNAIKYGGFKIGMAALLLDILKGLIPVYTAAKFLDFKCLYFILVLIAPVLGHALAPLSGWHGGKAIAVSFGCLLGLIPNSYVVFVLALILIILTFIVVVKPDSLRCIIAFSMFSVYCVRYVDIRSIRYGCILIAAIVIIKHLKAHEHAKAEVHIMILDKWRHRN